MAWNPFSAAVDMHPDSRMVASILDTLAAEFPIDAKRVYLIGQSVGGGAAWNLVMNKPERFAAVVLICPVMLHGVAPSSETAQVPLWVFQGQLDTANGAIATSRQVIDALKQLGGHPRFTMYPNAGHDIWTRAFADPELVQWLFAQAR